ncbi:MAG: acyl-CoA/acyl-ACP dehydrogenase [Sterolibacterium sp.]|nr:acyl-CoA/acyl-ACP dehydrogenase [Sterolibacterium sp.]
MSPVIDLDVGISEEMLALRETTHRFALEVMRPIAAQLDRMTPEAVIASDSPLWQGLEKFKEIGLVGAPDCYGPDLTPEARALMHAMVIEELCWGDVGLSITYSLWNLGASVARQMGREDLAEFFAARDEFFCLALTEPNHGSDMVAFNDASFRDPAGRADLRCRRDGEDYILNGQKAAWVSCGTIAGCGMVFATYEDTKIGRAGGAVFLLPLDLPGISRGQPLDKLGQRSLNQGEIFFDDVRVPAQFFLADDPELYTMMLGGFLAHANTAMGLQFVGVARAAFDHALAYARERVQGGKPIIEHQSVKARLFQMFMKLESARSFARQVAIQHYQRMGMIPFQYAAAAKVLVTQTAFEIASEALQMFGGNGLCREYPLEKIFRDARAGLIEDGENHMLGLTAANNF